MQAFFIHTAHSVEPKYLLNKRITASQQNNLIIKIMSYKIIEVHQVYKNDKLDEVAVLWQSNERGWVRASLCTAKPCTGYKFLMPNEDVTPTLIQQVAGQGMNLPDDKKEKYFPGKRMWER